MALATGIERRHVLEAMDRIRREGIPARARSTRFDVLHPNGTPFPPKLVLSMATRAATGRGLDRRDFSGGEQTNAPLRELGFTVIEKDTRDNDNSLRNLPAPGDAIANAELVGMFAVGNMGGMRWSSQRGCLVIVADHTKGLYDDRWIGNVLHYTGMGQTGNQTLSGQNRRLADQAATGVPVHLFEVFRQGNYVYVGQVQLVGEPHQERQIDDAGDERWVYVFPLALVDGAQRPAPDRRDLEHIESDRSRTMSKMSDAQLVKLAKLGGRQKPGVRQSTVAQYDRNSAVAELAKRLAQGSCDLCQEPAPFSVSGVPYLECHHVVHLAKDGPDTIDNAVALCPNCHRRMHALDRPADRKRLLSRIATRVMPSAGG